MWPIARLLLIAMLFGCLTARAALSVPVAAGPHASASEIRALRAASQGEVR